MDGASKKRCMIIFQMTTDSTNYSYTLVCVTHETPINKPKRSCWLNPIVYILKGVSIVAEYFTTWKHPSNTF